MLLNPRPVAFPPLRFCLNAAHRSGLKGRAAPYVTTELSAKIVQVLFTFMTRTGRQKGLKKVSIYSRRTLYSYKRNTVGEALHVHHRPIQFGETLRGIRDIFLGKTVRLLFTDKLEAPAKQRPGQ